MCSCGAKWRIMVVLLQPSAGLQCAHMQIFHALYFFVMVVIQHAI